MELWTIKRVLRWAADDFGRRGIASPRLDAELLIAHALEVDRVRLYMDLERPMSDAERERTRALVARRRRREPVAYILGEKGFYGRQFVVNSDALIPRPDTETLVARALEVLDPRRPPPLDEPACSDRPSSDPASAASVGALTEGDAAASTGAEAEVVYDDDLDERGEPRPLDLDALTAAAGGEGGADSGELAGPPSREPRSQPGAPRPSARVLDLCTGTGAIGLTILAERPHLGAVLTDLSGAALAVARQNAERLGVAERAELREGDLFGALPAGERFALIAVNPPYVTAAEIPELEPEVRDHEPRLALVSGPTGFEVLDRLVAEAGEHLEPGGTLLVEVGAGQADELRERLRAAPWVEEVHLHRDLGGIDRVVEARARAAQP